MATSLPSPPASRSASLEPEVESRAGTKGQGDSALFSVTGEEKHDEKKLSDRLDRLLESYLDLLDTYTKLREQLSKDLVSGFYALAQANRTSTLGPGRRYGEEGYDKRMKALKTVQIHRSEGIGIGRADLVKEAKNSSQMSPSADKPSIAEDFKERRGSHGAEAEAKRLERQHLDSTGTAASQDREHADTDADAEAVADGEPPKPDRPISNEGHQGHDTTRQSDVLGDSDGQSHHPASRQTFEDHSCQGDAAREFNDSDATSHYTYSTTSTASSHSTSATQNTSDKNSPREPTSTTSPKSPSKLAVKDPLRWYGILVPPALRQCQTHFSTSVSTTIPDLLSTISALDSLEWEIWQVRRDLGLLDKYKYDGNDMTPITRTCDEQQDNHLQTKVGSEKDPVLQSAQPHPEVYHGYSDSRNATQALGKKHSLLSSSATASEPRSRVLKLD